MQPSDITADGKPVRLYAEAGAFLSEIKTKTGSLITVRPNEVENRSGTSGFANRIWPQDKFRNSTSSHASIHTHQFSGGILKFNTNTIITHEGPILQGPSDSDHPTFNVPIREVMVDPKYIYLISHDPKNTIIFKRR